MNKLEYKHMIEDIVDLHHNNQKKIARGMVIALERMGKDMKQVYMDIDDEERDYIWDAQIEAERVM